VHSTYEHTHHFQETKSQIRLFKKRSQSKAIKWRPARDPSAEVHSTYKLAHHFQETKSQIRLFMKRSQSRGGPP